MRGTIASSIFLPFAANSTIVTVAEASAAETGSKPGRVARRSVHNAAPLNAPAAATMNPRLLNWTMRVSSKKGYRSCRGFFIAFPFGEIVFSEEIAFHLTNKTGFRPPSASNSELNLSGTDFRFAVHAGNLRWSQDFCKF
jgi:hypothetical protein